MSKFIAFRGCPASGKSTKARELRVKNHLNTFISNRDDIRRELYPADNSMGYDFKACDEQFITKRQHEFISTLLTSDRDNTVICDDTNLNPKFFDILIALAKKYTDDIEIIELFDVPLHVLLKRNIERVHSVPEDVIHRMFAAQLRLQNRIIEVDKNKLSCIVCDIDGTIAQSGRGPFEWDKVGQDKPKQQVINTVMEKYKDLPVIFLTGRDEVCLQDTIKWLQNHCPCYIDGKIELFMRKTGDHRPDTVYKEEVFRNNILPRFNVDLVFEDRRQVVDHLRHLGLEVWQVSQGRF